MTRLLLGRARRWVVNDEPEFTDRQMKAILALERALARAQKAGVAICGMDDTLLAYPAEDFDDCEAALGDSYKAQQALEDVAWNIEHHGAYRDSGGW